MYLKSVYTIQQKSNKYKMFLGISSIFLVTNNSISLIKFKLYWIYIIVPRQYYKIITLKNSVYVRVVIIISQICLQYC